MICDFCKYISDKITDQGLIHEDNSDDNWFIDSNSRIDLSIIYVMAKIDPKILGELERKIKIELLTTLPLLLLSVAIPFSAWHGIYQYDTEVTIWFQRSGSLMVLFAVWVEYKLFKISNLANPISGNGVTWQDMAHRDALNTKYGNILKIYKYITAVLAITGTVIWGYGDIIRGIKGFKP